MRPRELVSGARSPVGRRAGWSLGDQALSSITNFGLSVFVARAVDPREFGAFGLVFAAYLLILNLSRALGSQPLTIRFSAAPPEDQHAAVPGATGLALVVGITTGAILAVVAVCARGGTEAALLALAVTVPGLLLQDAWRFVFFAFSRPAAAALNDGVWAVAQVVAFAALYIHGVHTAAPYVLGWGLAACVAGAWGLVQARAVPSIAAGLRWLVAHRDIGPMLSLEFFATSGSGQLMVFGVAAVAGLTSVASLRAGQLVLGPLGVIYMGVLIIALPELTRVYVRDPDRMSRLAMLVGSLIAASALLVGLVAYFLPNSIGEALLRENWLPAHQVIIPIALALAFSGLMTGSVLQMRIVEAMKETLALRVALLVVSVSGATVGAYYWGAKGAAWAGALAGGLFAWLSWLQARRVLARKRISPAVGADAIS